MRLCIGMGALLAAFCMTSVHAQRDTIAPYRRAESVNPAPYRQKIAFVHPLPAQGPIEDAPLRRDSTLRRVTVTLSAPPELRALMQRYVDYHRSLTVVEGYRIQVFSGTNRDAASRVRGEVGTYFPSREVVFFFDRPYFKVRLGDFYSRAEADRILTEVRVWYPGAFVVPDRVKPPR